LESGLEIGQDICVWTQNFDNKRQGITALLSELRALSDLSNSNNKQNNCSARLLVRNTRSIFQLLSTYF